MYTYKYANLHTYKPAHLHTYKPAHLQTCTPAHLQTYTPNTLPQASLAAQHEARHVSNQAVDWEIRAIQDDIEDQRKRWVLGGRQDKEDDS